MNVQNKEITLQQIILCVEFFISVFDFEFLSYLIWVLNNFGICAVSTSGYIHMTRNVLLQYMLEI